MKGKRQATKKRNKRNFLLKGTLTCTIYALRHTHSHSLTHTHESLWPRTGQDQTRAQPQPVPESVTPLSPQCVVLWTASQVKWKTHQWKLKQKWQMVFCFLGSGLGPEPGRMSLQGRGRTINKSLTSIDFVAGKGKLVWVCLSTICLAFTSFLVPFLFAFALLSLLCLHSSLFRSLTPLSLSLSVSWPTLMEKNSVLMRRQLYLPARRLFSSFLPWYICRLWSFKLLSIMHNYLESFFRSLSLILVSLWATLIWFIRK